LSAETDIGDVGTLGQVDLEQHVVVRCERLVWSGHPHHARDEWCDHEARGLQHISEEGILLEAIATAELRLERVEIERHRAAKQSIKVFERDPSRMKRVKGGKHFQRRLPQPVAANAGEVRVKVDGHRSCLLKRVCGSSTRARVRTP